MKGKLTETLKDIYRQGFPTDPEPYVSYFFARVKRQNAAYVQKDGKIISAGYIIEKPAVLNGRRENLQFLSALATLKEYRGRGAIGNVLKKLFYKLYERGTAFTALYPFNHEFYKRYGFTNVSFCSGKTIQGGESYQETLYTELTSELLNKLSQIETAFSKKYDNFLFFGPEEISEKLKEYQLDGVPLRVYSDQNGIWAYCFTHNGRVLKYAATDTDRFFTVEALKGYYCFDYREASAPFVQGRIVHAFNALNSAPFIKSAVLQIIDAVMKENNITAEILVTKEGRSVSLSHKKPDLILDIAALTNLVLNGDGKIVEKRRNLFVDQY